MNVKKILIGLFVVCLLFPSDSLSEIKKETPVDYMIIFDASESMGYPINTQNISDFAFLRCDNSLVRDILSGDKTISYIQIARTLLRCYLQKYLKEDDRVAIIIIHESKELEVQGFFTVQEFSGIQDQLSLLEPKGITPLSEAIYESILFLNEKGEPAHDKILLIFSDLKQETPKYVHPCDIVYRIHDEFVDKLDLDSVLFFSLAFDRDEYEKIKQCFRDYLPHSVVVPIGDADIYWYLIDEVEYSRQETEKQRDECNENISEKNDLIATYQELIATYQEQNSNFLDQLSSRNDLLHEYQKDLNDRQEKIKLFEPFIVPLICFLIFGMAIAGYSLWKITSMKR